MSVARLATVQKLRCNDARHRTGATLAATNRKLRGDARPVPAQEDQSQWTYRAGGMERDVTWKTTPVHTIEWPSHTVELTDRNESFVLDAGWCRLLDYPYARLGDSSVALLR
eukprot:1537500-Prymnesium_polylepis.1